MKRKTYRFCDNKNIEQSKIAYRQNTVHPLCASKPLTFLFFNDTMWKITKKELSYENYKLCRLCTNAYHTTKLIAAQKEFCIRGALKAEFYEKNIKKKSPEPER